MQTKITLSILLIFFGWTYQNTLTSESSLESWRRLLMFSSENLNYNISTSQDSIIELCEKVESEVRAKKDYEKLFQVNQIMVNFYCLRGDIGLAIDKARLMYEEVKREKNQLGVVLALQSLGNTYMYTNKLDEANHMLKMAYDEMQLVDNKRIEIRLLLQWTHVHIYLRNTNEAEQALNKIARILNDVELKNEANYEFYYWTYRLIVNLRKKNWEQIDLYFGKLQNASVSKDVFERYIYMLSSYYFLAKKEYEKSLNYADSALSVIRINNDISEYVNSLTSKAQVLERMKRYGESYQVYAQVNHLTDSLDMSRYLTQMNTLRDNYWVDKLELESTHSYNKTLLWAIVFAFFVLVSVVMIVLVLKRKNRLLRQSREYLANESAKALRTIQTKSVFLSTMSHELRTPLNGIVGFSQLLATCEMVDDETKKQCGEAIRQNSDLLMKLINDVIDLSSLEENEMTFAFEKCEVIHLCQTVIQTVDAVKSTSAKFSFVCLLDKMELYSDRERLQQVLINLLVNATKFTLEGTITLKLNMDKERKNAVFTIEDTGCGIPLEKQSSIFNRFEKLHEEVQGYGLGLSICQLIVKRFGGNIWIDSEYTDGARIVFTHPLQDPLIKQEG